MRSISALTPVGDLHGIGAGLFLHRQADARAAVDAKQRTDVFRRVLHLGDVADVNRHAIARHQNQVPNLIEALELRLAPEQIRPVSLVHLAQRRVFVLGTEQRDDALDRQIQRRDFLF